MGKVIRVLKDINEINKEETIKRIINQAKNINDKRKTFRKAGVLDYNNIIRNTFTDDEMTYINGTGNLTKSTKYYNEKNTFVLKKILIKLAKINNHEVFGTVKKYNDNMTEQWNTLSHTIKEILQKRGYSDEYINSVIYTKNFYNSLNLEFEQLTKEYGSEQAVEKIFLNYASQNGLSEERVNEGLNNIMNNIENNRKLEETIKRQEDVKNFMETEEGKKMFEQFLRGQNAR